MTSRIEQKQHKDKWKRLFIGLCIFNGFILLLVLALIFWPAAENPHPTTEEIPAEESSEFTIRTTKENLNELINGYLDQLVAGSEHQYSVALEDDVHLMGELPVFSSSVPLSVHFEPIAQENGDLILRLRSISVGLLQLPNERIMSYMEDYLPMPPWVSVNPAEEEIYVAVTDINLGSNFNVKVEEIDLEANNISFQLEVPYQSLGINMMRP
ncbi:YpmS family protein [Lentibacillus sediminis]|uniref:YpmS family protein n=1 Tax=Lentibacillus sediminis TaxID=1940529 RepID=UPI000C1C1E28|nr:YpmS family protein [Lentibacillus sediminis]